MKFQETRERSIVKSIIYRTLIVATDLVVIYLITKKAVTTVALTMFTNLASTILYFLHERIWNNIAWGRQKAR